MSVSQHDRKKVWQNQALIEPNEPVRMYVRTNEQKKNWCCLHKFLKHRKKFGVENLLFKEAKKSHIHPHTNARPRTSQTKKKLLNSSDIIYQIFNFGTSKVFFAFLSTCCCSWWYWRCCCCCCLAPISNYCIDKIFGIKHATLNKLNFLLSFRSLLFFGQKDRW